MDKVLLSKQIIETQARTGGYAGVVFWHQDEHYIAVNHNYQTGMWVGEHFDGKYYGYSYGGPWIGNDTYYDLRVDADNVSSDLAVYLDDVYLFTHQVSMPKAYRTGLSGLWSGNAVGYFDNFRLTSKAIRPVPQGKPDEQGKKITAPVPQTGQKTSYYAGDDGELQMGVPWPDLRFTDRADGTVRDNLTGLIWLKNANCFGTKTWTEALDNCNTLGTDMCDLTDGSEAGAWRLPNINELLSLHDYSVNAPSLPIGHPFTNPQEVFY